VCYASIARQASSKLVMAVLKTILSSSLIPTFRKPYDIIGVETVQEYKDYLDVDKEELEGRRKWYVCFESDLGTL
jgi:hypothetical protein